MQQVILSPTKEVQARINAEAKKAELAAKREAAKAVKKEVFDNMDESLRGLNASAKYMSSKEGIQELKKLVPTFNGKVSKGQLLTAFQELDDTKVLASLLKGLESLNASNKIKGDLEKFIADKDSLSDIDKDNLESFLKDIPLPKNLILVQNNGERRKQFTNSQLERAAKHLSK